MLPTVCVENLAQITLYVPRNTSFYFFFWLGPPSLRKEESLITSHNLFKFQVELLYTFPRYTISYVSLVWKTPSLWWKDIQQFKNLKDGRDIRVLCRLKSNHYTINSHSSVAVSNLCDNEKEYHDIEHILWACPLHQPECILTNSGWPWKDNTKNWT